MDTNTQGIISHAFAVFPNEVFKAIGEFLLDKRTGSIILNVNQGRIESFELKEHHRVRPA